jgi:hypothetical protein
MKMITKTVTAFLCGALLGAFVVGYFGYARASRDFHRHLTLERILRWTAEGAVQGNTNGVMEVMRNIGTEMEDGSDGVAACSSNWNAAFELRNSEHEPK